ncbi:MAG TPA: ribonuclease HI family protein [Candidatus Bathyarchaeia archaeon]|nr:ribonuclease HI family protein [Candidatus Bathyarchaeia archaeon]
MQINVFCDGGARGNPGPAAVGFVIKDSAGKVIKKKGKYLGRATNNVAEYQAVVAALAWLSQQVKPDSQPVAYTFFLDSRLVVNQLNGLFKVKKASLRSLVVKIRQLEQAVGGNINYLFIKREKNQEADQLVNLTLDQKLLS